VRGVLKQCWRLQLVDAETLARATDVKPARGSRVDRQGRALTDGEIRALFVACAEDPSAAGVRDAAVFALLLGAGLRRAEVSSLRVEDYRPRPADGLGELIVRGKGNKERRVYVHRGAQAAVEDWLALRGAATGSLFVPVDRSGHVHTAGGFQGQSLAGMVRKRALQAGLAPFTPHDCRRTFISRLLDLGKDISTVADLAGHASVETTRSYDRRGERAAIEAAQAVHIPYVGRA
jgi:integrase